MGESMSRAAVERRILIRLSGKVRCDLAASIYLERGAILPDFRLSEEEQAELDLLRADPSRGPRDIKAMDGILKKEGTTYEAWLTERIEQARAALGDIVATHSAPGARQ